MGLVKYALYGLAGVGLYLVWKNKDSITENVSASPNTPSGVLSVTPGTAPGTALGGALYAKPNGPIASMIPQTNPPLDGLTASAYVTHPDLARPVPNNAFDFMTGTGRAGYRGSIPVQDPHGTQSPHGPPQPQPGPTQAVVPPGGMRKPFV